MQRNIEHVISRKTGRNTAKAVLAVGWRCNQQPVKEFS